ncbi:unnamed protein product, partial [Rotaria sp. Silwood2]
MAEEQKTAEAPLPSTVLNRHYLVDDPIRIRFFQNPRFHSKLKKYLSKTYNVSCQIVEDKEKQHEETGLRLNLIGDVKENMKHCQEFLKIIFASMQTKTYNNAKSDGKVINWSTHIYSERVLQTIQKIFDNRKLFTVWDKTEIFSGYYVVYYFKDSIQQLGASVESIDQILLEEISYVEITNQISNIKSKIFSQEFDQLIREIQKQQQEITILYCKEPQLKRNYLLDECSEKLRSIENQYKYDNIKLSVRQNEFQAPEYLVGKVKELVNQMIFDNFTIIFEQVETETPRTLTAKEDLELKHLALINNCHIVKIETKSKTKICSVPKAITITTISHQSKFITNQSILFSSSASVFYKVSISYASIEIHTMSNRFMDQKVDLTILSSTTDAIKEDIDINKDNSFVETQSGRKFVFVQWNLPSYNDDVQIKSKFKKKIKKFVSTSLQLITSNIKDEHLETIMFSTTEWEKCSNKKEFASEMINEIQHQLETRIGCRWRILFVFSKDEKQTELCQEFLSVMSTKQNEKDGFVAVSVPVTVTEITLSISRNNVWKKCQNALKDYIKQTICITKKLENQVDLKLWSQHMINAFYQYCITKYVILRMSLNNTEQIIELTGHTDTVDEAFDKYRLMTEILKQKVIEVAGSTMQSEPPNTSKTSSRKTTRNESTSSKEYYNIWLSYCKLDKKICSRLKERLIDEGYLVATNTSDDHTVTIKKCDLIILYLSEEYALSNASEMKEAKSSDKKILLIKPTKLACRGKNNWLHSMTTKQLSYELFNGNFTIELDTNNFDQEYDRLLIEI